jgi:hypothetical protein
VCSSILSLETAATVASIATSIKSNSSNVDTGNTVSMRNNLLICNKMTVPCTDTSICPCIESYISFILQSSSYYYSFHFLDYTSRLFWQGVRQDSTLVGKLFFGSLLVITLPTEQLVGNFYERKLALGRA